MNQTLTEEQFQFHITQLTKRFFPEGPRELPSFVFDPTADFVFVNVAAFTWEGRNDPEAELHKALQRIGVAGYINVITEDGKWYVHSPILKSVPYYAIVKEAMATIEAVFTAPEYRSLSTESIITNGDFDSLGSSVNPTSYTANSYLAHALGDIDGHLTYNEARRMAHALRAFGISEIYYHN